MKKVFLVLVALSICAIASAQLKIVALNEKADTLVYMSKFTSAEGQFLDVYKGEKGYQIRVRSTNMFDKAESFYIGLTRESALRTLEDLAQFFEKDIATSAVLEDCQGNQFALLTAALNKNHRRTTFIKSDRIYLYNEKMAGHMCIDQKILEEAIKFFK